MKIFHIKQKVLCLDSFGFMHIDGRIIANPPQVGETYTVVHVVPISIQRRHSEGLILAESQKFKNDTQLTPAFESICFMPVEWLN